ncbi:MAG: hypothetical protein ACREJG_03815, partial [Candidatus Rokuibacteriota bacterium]
LAHPVHVDVPMPGRASASAILILALIAPGIVHGAVPTAEDFATCNAEAQDAVKAGSASPSTAEPTTKDEGRAAQARRGDKPTDAAGRIAGSPDPQLEGMDAGGAKDPVYQAAYRTCMRKSGF